MRPLLAVLSTALLLLLATPAAAQPQGIGVGPQLAVSNTGGAAPVGASLKLWINDRQAVTAATSFAITDSDIGSSFWILEANYVFHNFSVIDLEEGDLGTYVGGGIQYLIYDHIQDGFSFRAPIGVNYLLPEAPVDFFIEVAPTLQVNEPVQLRFDGAIGFRYYFRTGS